MTDDARSIVGREKGRFDRAPWVGEVGIKHRRARLVEQDGPLREALAAAAAAAAARQHIISRPFSTAGRISLVYPDQRFPEAVEGDGRR